MLNENDMMNNFGSNNDNHTDEDDFLRELSLLKIKAKTGNLM